MYIYTHRNYFANLFQGVRFSPNGELASLGSSTQCQVWVWRRRYIGFIPPVCAIIKKYIFKMTITKFFSRSLEKVVPVTLLTFGIFASLDDCSTFFLQKLETCKLTSTDSENPVFRVIVLCLQTCSSLIIESDHLSWLCKSNLDTILVSDMSERRQWDLYSLTHRKKKSHPDISLEKK